MTKNSKTLLITLPLSETDLAKYVEAMGGDEPLLCDRVAIENALMAVGVPAHDSAPVATTLGTLREPVPCVRQSDHLAKLAERDAEIVRLKRDMEAASYHARIGAWSRAHLILEKALKGPEA